MDYEKKYNEALNDMRAIYPNLKGDAKLAVEHAFPELRESEDERVRKWIYNLVSDLDSQDEDAEKELDEMKPLALAWLEKQKEQPQEELVYRLNGLMQEYIKEGKDEAEKEHRFKCYQLFWDALEDADFFEQKEQKPIVLDEDTQLGIERAIQIVCSAKGKLYGYQSDDGIYECDHAIRVLKNILENGIEQKPAEWSESDTVMCNAALELLHSHPNLMASHGINKSSVIRWLQSFRPRKQGFIDDICSKAGIAIPYLDGNQWCILKGDNIQAGVVGFGGTKEDALANFIKDVPIPQQWSEEDEKILERFLGWLQGTMGEKTYSSWLKSLRERFNLQPKQEWSEEDEKELDCIINVLDRLGFEEFCKSSRDQDNEEERFYYKEIQFLKRLKSLRPSWCPSEEQEEPEYYQHFDPDC